MTIWRATTVIVLCATICGCAGVSSSGESWRKSFDQGFTLEQQQNYDKALQAYRDALKQVDGDNAPNIRRAKTLDALSKVYIAQGNSVEAEHMLNRAVTEYEKLSHAEGHGEDSRDYALGLASDCLALGNIARDAVRFDQADALYKRAFEVEETALGADDLKRSILENRANLYKMTGRNAEATKLLDRAKDLTPMDAIARETSADTWRSLEKKADEASRGGNYKVAKELYQAAYKRAEAAGERMNMANTLKELAIIEEMNGEGKEAIQTLERAISIATIEKKESDSRAKMLLALAGIYERHNQVDKAESLAREACSISTNIPNSEYRDYRDALVLLAEILAKEHKFPEAEKAASTYLNVEKEQYGPDNEKIAEAYALMARMQGLAQKNQEAQASFEKALDILQKAPDVTPRRQLTVLDEYAKFLRSANQSALADSIEMKAKNLRSEYE